MADNKNRTIYQDLNKFLNIDTIGGNNNLTTGVNASPNSQSRKIIIKGNTPEEIYRKGLEIEQKQKLQDKFFRTSDRGFQKAMQYEAARLPAYIDYEGMEFYPLIASALDLFMEESTTIGSTGKMLNIYSNKERIKLTLEDFFYNIVNVNTNLPFWTRNLCKYGDNFVNLYGESKKGITSVRQMVNYEIERFERVQDGKMSIKFKERMTGDEFNTFEMAHFRLLGDDKMIPYGSSTLNKCRRVFRQLCLDSNTDIWTPNGYTKIKNLNIGDDIFSYDYNTKKVIITKVKNVFKTGEKERFKVRTNHREIILTEDHPLLTTDFDSNYKYKNINEIDKEKLILPSILEGNNSFKIKLDHKDYYVLLTEKGKYKTKKIESIGIINRLRSLGCDTTIKNLHYFIKGGNRGIKYNDFMILSEEFNLTLDDVNLYYFNSRKKAIVNKNLEFIVDKNFARLFGFMLGDGWINEFNQNIGFALGVYEDENKYYINLCKSFGDFNHIRSDKPNTLSSQANFYSRELKNIFEKLEFKTGAFNKRIPEWVFTLSYENKIEFIKGMFDADGCDNNNTYSSSNYNLIYDLKVLAESCNLKIGKILDDNRTIVKLNNKIVSRQKSYLLYIKINEIGNTPQLEERILTKENIGIGEVWDIEVENELHNFIANGIVVHNCLAEDAMLTYRLIRAGEKKVFKIDVGNIDEDDVEEYMYKVSEKFKRTPQIDQNNGQIDYRFNIMGVDEDFFIPVRNANVQTGIDTLPGASNLNDINDISYLRDNLFIGLGIPKPFLSFQDASGGGKNIAQFDIRFSKKVNRIQQAMIQELNKMAMIHLYYLGFEAEDLNNFALSLTNPSTQQELLKIELMQAKAQVYGDMTRAEAGIAAMSHTNAKRQILNMSDSDIVEDLRQQKMEKVIMQEFADSPVVIKKTGLFADIDKKYGADAENMTPSGATSPAGAPMGGGGMSGGGGGAPMGGGGMPPTGTEPPAEGELPPMGGEEGETPAPIAGLPNQSPSDLPPIKEGFRREMDETTYNKYVNKLVYGENHKENTIKQETSRLIMETQSSMLDLNSKALNLINEIENMVYDDKNIIQDITEDESDINLNELNLDEEN